MGVWRLTLETEAKNVYAEQLKRIVYRWPTRVAKYPWVKLNTYRFISKAKMQTI